MNTDTFEDFLREIGRETVKLGILEYADGRLVVDISVADRPGRRSIGYFWQIDGDKIKFLHGIR